MRQDRMMAGEQQRSLGALSEGRRNNFDLLRLLFAILVVYSHSFELLRGRTAYDPLTRLTGGQLGFGQLAVDGFFVISGFLIARSWLGSTNTANFVQKRVLRIVPGFTAAWVISLLIVGPLGAASAAGYIRGIHLSGHPVADLTLSSLPPTFTQNPVSNAVNGNLWTIPPEFACYMLVAALGLAGAFRVRWLPVSMFALAIVVYAALERHAHVPLSGTLTAFGGPDFYPRVFVHFMAGVTIFVLRRHIPVSRSLLALACVTLVLADIVGGLRLAMPLVGSYIILSVAFDPAVRLHDVTRGIDLSYGIYLYGFPVGQLLVLQFSDSLSPATLFAVCLPLTATLAAMSWFLVERPFLRMKQHPLRRPMARMHRAPLVQPVASPD